MQNLNKVTLHKFFADSENCTHFINKDLTKPVDTGRKLNVHKTLRRRPRRLLNILCMFSLRAVSTRKPEVHSKLCQTCKIEDFLKIFYS